MLSLALQRFELQPRRKEGGVEACFFFKTGLLKNQTKPNPRIHSKESFVCFSVRGMEPKTVHNAMQVLYW